MPELRWILIAFGIALLIGIYAWGRRASKPAATDDVALPVRPAPVFDSTSYEEYERPLVAPIEDVEVVEVSEEPLEVERSGPRSKRFDPPPRFVDDADEPTIDVKVERPAREARAGRIEPTFSEETVTAELPVDDVESIVTPQHVDLRAEVRTEMRAEAEPPKDAPTLGMSSTPAPRRIERRKIIALRLAWGPQKLPGAQLRSALEGESLQHGKYDVFHRLDGNGAAIFSIASMVEPGTFDLEKMTQESFPGVTLFAQLPAPVAGMLAFNELIACSRRLHAALGGTLQDERGVPLTVHRIERLRQEIREFEHKPVNDPNRSGSSVSPTL
jgi:cell division protein ZipA